MFVRLLALALLAAVVAAIAAHRSDSAGADLVYIVKPYDTVWSIASAHYAGDPRDAISRIERRNGLRDALIRPGQRLVLPRYPHLLAAKGAKRRLSTSALQSARGPRPRLPRHLRVDADRPAGTGGAP